MEAYGGTDVGLVRKTNQDAISYGKSPDGTIWAVVCDGMGGVNGGDVAGDLASRKISSVIEETMRKERLKASDFKDLLARAVKEANSAVYEASRENVSLKGMGTTAVAAIITENAARVCHVGDSRAYAVNDLGINQITVDHSVVQEMVNAGEITKEEARTHPKKNIITRALGVGEEISPDYVEYEVKRGDRVILCTDGLTNELSEREIKDLILKTPAKDVPGALIDAAKRGGGADNISCVFVLI